MLNKVFLIGNLTRDPDVRYLPSGTALTEFDLAVNRRFKDRNGEMKEDTLFIRITTWARTAEICAEYLKKGSRILVEGRLKQDTWEAKDGSGKRSRITVVGENVQFMDPKSSSSGPPRQAEPSRAGASQRQMDDSGGGDNDYSYESDEPPGDSSHGNEAEDDLPF